MTRNWLKVPQSMREIINRLPHDGCLIMFNVNRKSVQSRVSEMGLTEYLEVHKLTPEYRTRDNSNVPCDVYIGWREDK